MNQFYLGMASLRESVESSGLRRDDKQQNKRFEGMVLDSSYPTSFVH